jgi:hypothetical protein
LRFLLYFKPKKTKARPSGLPDSNFIFFVATKKTKQKKARRCAGHVVREAFWWQKPEEETCFNQHFPR